MQSACALKCMRSVCMRAHTRARAHECVCVCVCVYLQVNVLMYVCTMRMIEQLKKSTKKQIN